MKKTDLSHMISKQDDRNTIKLNRLKMGKTLKERRVELNITQKTLAEDMRKFNEEFTTLHISRLELGLVRFPTEIVENLSILLNIPEEELLTRAEKQVLETDPNRKISIQAKASSVTQELPNSLAHYRRIANLSQVELGKLVDRAGNQIARYEKGSHKIPRLILDRFSEVLKVSTEEILSPVKIQIAASIPHAPRKKRVDSNTKNVPSEISLDTLAPFKYNNNSAADKAMTFDHRRRMGLVVKELRKNKGLIQDKLGSMFELDSSCNAVQIYRLEAGISPFTVAVLNEYTRIFDISISEIIEKANSHKSQVNEKNFGLGIVSQGKTNNLREVRLSFNITQETLANILELTTASVSYYERGGFVAYTRLLKISDFLEIPVETLIPENLEVLKIERFSKEYKMQTQETQETKIKPPRQNRTFPEDTIQGRLRRLREKLGLSREQLADMTGLKMSVIKRYETSETAFYSFVTLYTIAEKLECDINDIVKISTSQPEEKIVEVDKYQDKIDLKYQEMFEVFVNNFTDEQKDNLYVSFLDVKHNNNDKKGFFNKLFG